MSENDVNSGGDPSSQPLVWPSADDNSTSQDNAAAEPGGGNVGVLDAPAAPNAESAAGADAPAADQPAADPANLSDRGAPLLPLTPSQSPGSSAGVGPLQTRRPPGYGQSSGTDVPPASPLGYSGGGVSGYGTGPSYAQGAGYGPNQPTVRWGYSGSSTNPTYVPPPPPSNSEWGRPDPHKRQMGGALTLLVIVVVIASLVGAGAFIYSKQSDDETANKKIPTAYGRDPELDRDIYFDNPNIQNAPQNTQPVGVNQLERHDEAVGPVTVSVPNAYTNHQDLVDDKIATMKSALNTNLQNVQVVGGAWATDDQGVIVLYASADGVDSSTLLNNSEFRQSLVDSQSLGGGELKNGTIAGHPALVVNGTLNAGTQYAQMRVGVVPNGNGFAVILAFDDTTNFEMSASSVFDSLRIS